MLTGNNPGEAAERSNQLKTPQNEKKKKDLLQLYFQSDL